ncbi:hypothetical protein C8J56DRAFT_1051863 [Mycena floridula]|nr:hypothetical protein C8J56DRAFT_1051863 [Mycena floridula]
MVSLDAGCPHFLENFGWMQENGCNVPMIHALDDMGFRVKSSPAWFTVTGIVESDGLFVSMSGDAKRPVDLPEARFRFRLRDPGDDCSLYSFRRAYSNLLAFQKMATIDICGGHMLRNGRVHFEQRVFSLKKVEHVAALDEIVTWSVAPKFQESLSAIRTTHEVNPLVVHLPEGDDVHPAILVDALADTLVQVDFKVTHEHVEAERRDYFRANIIRVRVLPHNWVDTVVKYRNKVYDSVTWDPPPTAVELWGVSDEDQDDDG